MDRVALRDQLIRHEGRRLKPYLDSVGKWTIGVGRNLTDVGITVPECDAMLEGDIDRAVKLMREHLPWLDRLDDVRQNVLLNMAFNLGVDGVLKFTNTLALIEAGSYGAAADAMLASKWARQVGHRAEELATMIRTGAWPA